MQSGLKCRIFLVGCPRSGTTLLQSFLSAHPDIASFPETHFFRYLISSWPWVRFLGIVSLSRRRHLKEIVQELAKNRIEEFRYDENQLLVRKQARVFVSLLDDLSNKQGKKIWIEKTPRHLHYISNIENIVEGVKFIHIVRNGPDVVASLFEVTRKYPNIWGGARSIDQCISRWVEDIKINLKYLKKNNHMLVRYEWLADDPSFVLEEICGFIGIPFDNKMIQEYGVAAKKVIGDGELWKKSVTQPIKCANATKFFKLFDADQRHYIIDRLSAFNLDKLLGKQLFQISSSLKRKCENSTC